jgi:phage tail-like protein
MATHPYGAFNFIVEIGSSMIGFMECTGLDSETATMEYRDSALPQGATATGSYVRKLPGRESYPNVVLRRGMTADTSLWETHEQIRDGTWVNYDGFNVTITLQDERRQTVMTWELQNAWPNKISGPVLNARTNEIAIETLELCCDRIVLTEAEPKSPPTASA